MYGWVVKLNPFEISARHLCRRKTLSSLLANVVTTIPYLFDRCDTNTLQRGRRPSACPAAWNSQHTFYNADTASSRK